MPDYLDRPVGEQPLVALAVHHNIYYLLASQLFTAESHTTEVLRADVVDVQLPFIDTYHPFGSHEVGDAVREGIDVVQ